DMARLLQGLSKRAQTLHVVLKRCGAEEADHRCCRLLRARRERPRSRCAADELDELAPVHSITSSPRSRNSRLTVNPSIRAVLRFTTRSNLLGCSIGISAGFVPLKILST